MSEAGGPVRKKSDAGSPATGGPVFLVIGKLRRPHGFHGEIQMDVLTDFPERIRKGKRIYVGEKHEPITIERVRKHDRALLITLEGVDEVNAGEYRNKMVYVRADEIPSLPEGEYYIYQVLGLPVKDMEGHLLGELKEILETGANQVYVVVNEQGEERLFPAIAEVVQEINLEEGYILVKPQEWS